MSEKNLVRPDIVERLGPTRARIEAAVRGPSVLVVTSATAADGSSLLASALAQSLILAGHSVLLVRSESGATIRRGESGALAGDTQLRSPRGTNRETAIVALSMSGSNDLFSLESIRTALAAYRERFAFTVIDAPGALASGSALSFARAADLVIVAFEDGRAARSADRELAKTLKSMGAPVLGVVTLDPKTIAVESKKRAPSVQRANSSAPAVPSPIG